MQQRRETELVASYRLMPLEDQLAILAIVKERAQAAIKIRPTLRIVGGSVYKSDAGAFSNIARS